MDLIKKLKEEAQELNRKIILPESEDERILKAADIAAKETVAQVHLLGKPDEIMSKAHKLGLKLDDVILIDSSDHDLIARAANHYYERRKHKGTSLEKSLRIMQEQKVYLAATLVGMGEMDGMVAGAITATSKVIKAGIYCIGLNESCKLVSSYFIMVTQDRAMGENGCFFFADCGVNPNPNSEQLADIAMSTADSFKSIMKTDPKIAMLSFSTKGSATHPDIGKVTSALSIAKLKYPELCIDGEMQLDAAVIPEIANRKAPNSPIQGDANVLIFPDLDAGNIGYKLVERFGKAKALGPIIQGLKNPINDLSRGCSIEDIVRVIEITVLTSKKQ